jgi:hypothetical protein
MLKTNKMTSNFKFIDYLYTNFEITHTEDIWADKYDDTTWNYLVYIRNKLTGEVLKTKWGAYRPPTDTDMYLLEILYNIASCISLYDEIDDFGYDYDKKIRIMRLVRRQKRALMRLIDEYDINDFIDNIRELEL